MHNKIFLQGSRSKESTNTSSSLHVQLGGKKKLLPPSDVSDTVNLYDLYTEERRGCNIIRLTCQVNPICSNVLFNPVTEVVKNEGGSAVTVVNYGLVGEGNPFSGVKYKPSNMGFWSGSTIGYQSIDSYAESADVENTPIANVAANLTYSVTELAGGVANYPANAVRDTQLSNSVNGFDYHCGLDIFNNHLLRSNTFKCVCKMPSQNVDARYTAFNTIADLMRDVQGDKVAEKLSFPIEAGVDKNGKIAVLHLYEYDDILTFNDAVSQRLIAKHDGWVGFENTSKIKTYDDFAEGSELQIERPIMNKNAGDFVDMYPSRDLYSFVPKYNKFQRRMEKNWNYCVTYPMSSTTDGFDDIINTVDGLNSLRAIYFDENTRGDNGVKQIVIYSIAKHGLQVGDYVNIYKSYESSGDSVNELVVSNAEVGNVVDDFIFTVSNSTVQISNSWVAVEDIPNSYELGANGLYYTPSKNADPSKKYYIVNNAYVNFDNAAQNISYKKVVNGIECDYYVRVFSKVPNFKHASGDTSNEYEIYRKRDVNGELPLVDEYKKRQYDFENHISRLAFAKNAYSDEIGQVVFTDNIDISNIKDNLGRPLTTLYLTILKSNKGYKQWYGVNSTATWNPRVINDDFRNIEYSHCFGKLSCAFETSDESIADDTITSVKQINNIDNLHRGYDVDKINGDDRSLDGYSIDVDEIWYDTDVNFYGDLCYYDNYNAMERSIQPMMYRFNTAQRESSVNSDSSAYFSSYLYDEIACDDYDVAATRSGYTIAANVQSNVNAKKEGYYYSPHYEIPIKTFDKLQSIFPTFLTIRSITPIGGNSYRITTLQNHFLSLGDKAVIYDSEADKYYTCVAVRGDGDSYRTFTCKTFDYDTAEAKELDFSSTTALKMFKIDNLEVPSYAKLLKDGTCRFIWRDILNNGFNSSDDTVEEYPFTNGAFYVNKKVDMYVKRQDPYNRYGLYSEDDLEGSSTDTTVTENNYYSEEDIVC